MVCDLTIAADNAIFGQTGPKVIHHSFYFYIPFSFILFRLNQIKFKQTLILLLHCMILAQTFLHLFPKIVIPVNTCCSCIHDPIKPFNQKEWVNYGNYKVPVVFQYVLALVI